MPEPNLEPLEPREYAQVRKMALELTTALGTMPVMVLDRLIGTIEALHTPEHRAELVAAGELNLDQIDAAKAGVELELRLFRGLRQWRASLELIRAEAMRLSQPSNVLDVPHVSKRQNGAANGPEEGANDG